MKNIEPISNNQEFRTIESANKTNPSWIYNLSGKILALIVSLINIKPIGISLRFTSYTSADSLVHYVLHKLMIWLEINPQILLITDFVYEITIIAFAIIAFVEVIEEILIKIIEILERLKK